MVQWIQCLAAVCCKVALGSVPQPSTPKMGSSKVDEKIHRRPHQNLLMNSPQKSSCPAVLKINPKILRNQECQGFSEKHSPRMQCILKIHQILRMPKLAKPWPPSCFFLWLQFFISLSNFSEVTGLLANIMKAISSLFPFILIPSMQKFLISMVFLFCM